MKDFLKRLRGLGPLNSALTRIVRLILRLTGRTPGLAARHLPRVGTVKATLPNGASLVMSSRGDDWVANQVFWHGWTGYEPELSPLFWRAAVEAGVTVDIGAHVGFYALLAARANPAARVFAFEPLDATFERLRRNLGLNDARNVEAVHAAAGSRDGRFPLFRTSAKIPCSASLSREFMEAEHGDTHTIEQIEVSVLALDPFLEQRAVERLDLVKIDVDGYEAEVLAGLRDVVRRDRPTIFCEVTSVSGGEAIAADLRPLGYSFYALTDAGPERRLSVEPDPRWTNQLFVARS